MKRTGLAKELLQRQCYRVGVFSDTAATNVDTLYSRFVQTNCYYYYFPRVYLYVFKVRRQDDKDDDVFKKKKNELRSVYEYMIYILIYVHIMFTKGIFLEDLSGDKFVIMILLYFASSL